MLLANETVAPHLAEHEVPALYRVHEAPDPMKVERVRGVHRHARLQPGASGGRVKPKHFQKLVERIKGKPEERADRRS